MRSSFIAKTRKIAFKINILQNLSLYYADEGGNEGCLLYPLHCGERVREILYLCVCVSVCVCLCVTEWGEGGRLRETEAIKDS